ncbi:MAG: DUF4907 domain-containing protein [Bacteroidetes bacterium]|nr:DUF4907 domain-containing protein [Bacteroidota bacterium]
MNRFDRQKRVRIFAKVPLADQPHKYKLFRLAGIFLKDCKVMRSVLIFFLIALSSAIFAQAGRIQPQGSPSAGMEEPKIPICTYTLIPSVNKTWGYDIYVDKQLFIHQPNVPGLPGNEGFKTKADARKIAKLVTGKIKKGEMPPGVTLEEMKTLKVL